MGRRRAGHTGRRLLALLLLAAAGIGSGAVIWQQEQKSEAETATYKEETVRRGLVSTGIQESGTVEYGTKEQIFEVAGITEVSADSEADSAATSSAVQAQGSSRSGAESTGGTFTVAARLAGQSGSTTTESSSAAGETALEVEDVYVACGQEIEAGDRILRITDESIAEYRAQLEAAVASAQLSVSQEEINVETKQAEADYTYQMYLAEGETARETYDATITSLEERVADLEEQIEEEDDEDELEELEAELKLAQNNLATGSIEAEQTYENAMTNYKYADQLHAIDLDGLEDDLKEAQETLAKCQENLEEFEAQIGDGVVYAAYGGTVSEVAYAAGDVIVNDAVVVTCMDPENVTMTVSVSQEDIAGVAVGDAASIILSAYDDVAYAAEITGISTSPAVGSATVNYDVTARFTGDIGKVYSGMTGEMNLAGETVEDALCISARALCQDGERTWVRMRQEDGMVAEADVETGLSNGRIVEVKSGLEEGQTVLVEGQVTQ